MKHPLESSFSRRRAHRRTASGGQRRVGPVLAVFCAALALAAVVPATSRGASTEPRFALVRAVALRAGDSARISLQLETSFSFADTLQLALPLEVVVHQGALAARFDLAGNVFTSTAGSAEQPGAGPGILSVTEREILLVLPSGFAAGPATVQLSTNAGGHLLTSNTLGLTL